MSSSQIIDARPEACPPGLFTQQNRPSLCLLVSLGVGIIAALLGEIIGFTDAGHKINDPILMTLSISTLIRSFIYFNFWNFIRPIIYAVAMAVITGAALRFIATQNGLRAHKSNAQTATTVAMLVSFIPIVLQEISGLQVFLWYGVSIWFSVLIARAVAARAA